MNIRWSGCPMVSDNAADNPKRGWIATVQLGFREDGVVVWRENKPDLEHPAPVQERKEEVPDLLKNARFVEKIPACCKAIEDAKAKS